MSSDPFSSVELAPADAIFALTAAFKADSTSDKINLGAGAYRTNEGKPWVLPVVKKASDIIANDETLDHEYLPIAGLPSFYNAGAKLILGEGSKALKEGRVASTQTISGTGANHLGAAFLKRFYPFPSGKAQIYISNPTWMNHHAIFKNVGIEPVTYPYYDPATVGLDFEGYKASLNAAEDGSVFLIHGCAHNPTGVDPTPAQWSEIIEILLRKKHFAFLDCAYQGFASGDLDKDAAAVREMEARNVPLLVCQSFSKNAGLYSERVGALHLVSPTTTETPILVSQLALLQRSEISNPPAWGARVVSLILNDEKMFQQWKEEIQVMAGRIKEMRSEMRRRLEELGTPGTWEHVTKQIGMFSYTGLTTPQVKILVEEHHIYLTNNGRISMAGLNTGNIERFTKAVDAVVRASAKQ
ncbi:aspartate aminotransferase [Mrakia frigida]|uniref:aspartate aminotransferase n=1 Tax=Mrakia frigida TaxID=29902 RepID=UPI003FCC1F7E